ncbi:MAG: hypothetical protein ACE5G1_11920 [bacterium]
MFKKIHISMFLPMLIFSAACTGGEEPREAAVFSSSGSRAGDFLSYIPVETNILFYANFNSLKNTPFGEDLSDELEDRIKVKPDDRDYREFVEETGVDLQRDIYEVMFASNGRDGSAQLGGAILRGKFDEDRIVEYMKEERSHRVRDRSYRGYKIYQLDDRGRRRHNDFDGEFVFLNKETVAVGDPEWLENVISLVEDDGKSVKENAVMVNFMEDIPDKEQLWAVINLDEISEDWHRRVRRSGSAFKGTQSIENMKSIIFHAEVHQTATLNLKGSFGTEEEAELLAETLNGFKAMAKLMMMDDKEAVDMLNEIKIRASGPVLRLTTTIDKDFISKIEEKRDKYRRKGIELP